MLFGRSDVQVSWWCVAGRGLGLVGLALALLVVSGCAEEPEAEQAIAMQEQGAFYDHPDAFCDEDADRPVWSDVEGLHYLPTPATSHPVQTPRERYPDYRNISTNLNVLESLQFLLSTITNITSLLEDASETLENGTWVDHLGQSVPQAYGHCLCVNGQCDPAVVFPQVESAIQQLVDVQEIELFLQSFLQQKVDATIQDFQALLADLESLIDPQNLTSVLASSLGDAFEDEIAEAWDTYQGTLSACSLFDPNNQAGNLGAAIDAAVSDALTYLNDELASDAEMVTDLVEDLVALSGALTQLQEDVSTLLGYFAGVSSVSELVQVDWAGLIATVQAMVPTYQQLATDVQDAISDAGEIWDVVSNYDTRIEELADELRQQMLDALASFQNGYDDCVAQLQDVGNFVGGLSQQDFIDGLEQALTGAFETIWDQARTRVMQTWQELEDRITGLPGELAMSFFDNQAQGILNVANQVASDCYSRVMRPECFDFCNATDADDFRWFPTDFLEDPAAVAGSAGLFVLEQTKWLDQVVSWVQTNLAGSLGQGLQQIIGVLTDVASAVQKVIDFLSEAFGYIDRFTEGYHLGAYNEVRPDLHMCIGYAGHGAYAQMAGLGGDRFSLGARYTGHNLSAKNRMQFRSGGFALSALGKELSLAPSVEFNAQLDGWQLWDPTRPFGIPMNIPIGSGNNPTVAAMAQYDVFHVIPETNPFGPNGFAGSILVRDLFPSRPDALSMPEWPPREAYDCQVAPSGNASDCSLGSYFVVDTLCPGSTSCATPTQGSWCCAMEDGWASRSAAVLSLGLNLRFDLPALDEDKIRYDLVTIQIIPGVLSATPYIAFRMGVEWMHQTDYLLDRLEAVVNENLLPVDQIGPEEFHRDMHFFQAPDLTADNGTAVYVEPELGIEAFLGFKVWKIKVGAGASVGVAVNLRPGGHGGVIDANAALADALLHSNPPLDAPCEPIWTQVDEVSCNNTMFDESTGSYACDPGDAAGSCCIDVQVIGEGQGGRLCIDAWTGMDREWCGYLNEISGTVEEVSGILDQLPAFLSRIRNAIMPLIEHARQVRITATWNDEGCSERGCGEGTVQTILNTAGTAFSGMSECQAHGWCTWPDGMVQHDLTLAECEDDRENPGSFTAYACRTQSSAELEGWQGSGCHPLQHGFPTACGCATDDHCATGETCDADTGRCTAGGSAISCVCGSGGSCPSGRSCVDGACLVGCSVAADCAPGLECSSGWCRPPHTIPFAEEITWGMANVEAPMHLISSYALSDFLATLLMPTNIFVELSFKLFGKERTWRVVDFNRIFDLGSLYKGWYQPGLEALYQGECDNALLDEPVTNRYPRSLTSLGFGSMLDNAGVSALRSCPNGGVCRYQEGNLPASQNSPELHTRGNSGDVATFLEWCMEDMPQHVENPAPSTNDDLTNGILDTFEFQEEFTLELWARNQLCINGEVWDDWLAGLYPTFDNDGNVTDPGTIASADCTYDDPQTGQSHVFPCNDITDNMLRIWGCLDPQANIYAAALAQQFPQLLLNDPNTGAYLDIEEMFNPVLVNDPIYGPGLEYPYTVASMKNIYRFATAFPLVQLGHFWLMHVDACFESRFEDPAESACPCTVDSDCDDAFGERCNAGRCEGRVGDQWQPRECPIVYIDIEAGPCCGDGIVQNTDSYSEECDGGPNCDENCNLIEEIHRGACCAGDGVCFENLTPDECPGTWHAGMDCLELDYCEGSDDGEPTGACCTETECLPAVTAATCGWAGGLFHEGEACNQEDTCPGEEPLGACCTSTHCLPATTAAQCANLDGTFSAGGSCTADFCGPDDPTLGACCTASGCLPNFAESDCNAVGGGFHAGTACTPGLCTPDEPDPTDPPPAGGACCNAHPSFAPCTEVDRREDCAAIGGTWQGGATCDQADLCPPAPIFGACCLPDGYCRDHITEDQCDDLDGTFSPGITCEQCLCEPEEPADAGDTADGGSGGGGGGCSAAGSPASSLWALMLLPLLALRRRRALLALAGATALTLAACADPAGPAEGPQEEPAAAQGEQRQKSDAGACCVDGADCFETEERECDGAGGTFSAGRSCDEVNQCRPVEPGTGACCTASGCTSPVTAESCDTSGGIFTAGVVCGQVEGGCRFACCQADGSCDEAVVTLCERHGGTGFFGRSCDEIDECPLPEVEGACCVEGMDCFVTVERECDGAGGEFNTGSSCDEVSQCRPEEPETGACCSGSDCFETTELECLTLRWLYFAGQTCAEVADAGHCNLAPEDGACCLPDGSCAVYTAQGCERFGGAYHPGQTCAQVNYCRDIVDPIGACCDGESCEERTETECLTLRHVFFEGLTCADVAAMEICSSGPPTGACCYGNGLCQNDVADRVCERVGGTFHEDLSCADIADACVPMEPPPTGACCTDWGCVPNLTDERCAAIDGAFHAGEDCDQDTTCPTDPPTGACCTEDGCLSGQAEAHCDALDGTWLDGQDCGPLTCDGVDEPTGACCSDGIYGSFGTGRGFVCALTPSGTPFCAGPSAQNMNVPPGPYVELDASSFWACARTASGTTDCWTIGGATVTASAPALASLHVGSNVACGVTLFGQIACWDPSGAAVPTGPPAGPWAQVVTDWTGLCGLRTDGSVACWGGQVNTSAPFGTSSFTEIAMEGGAVCALDAGGDLFCEQVAGQSCAPGNTAGPLTDLRVLSQCTFCGIDGSGDLTCHGTLSGPAGLAPVTAWDGFVGYLCVQRPDLTVDCYNWILDGVSVSNVALPASGTCVGDIGASACVGIFHEGQSCDQVAWCTTVPTGACCTADDCHDWVSQSACDTLGGLWTEGHGCDAGVECPGGETGACCGPGSGVCTDGATAADCTATGGSFVPGATCDALDQCFAGTGACCTSSACYDGVSEVLCGGIHGLFTAGATCMDDIPCAEQLGACCIEETGECLDDQTADACADVGGVYYPDLSCGLCDCSPIVEEDEPPTGGGGGGCSTVPSSGHAGWLLALAGLLALRRRTAA